MASSFWTNTLSKDFEKISESSGEKVRISHKEMEEIHELAIDIYEGIEYVSVVVPIAGVQASDIEISVDENIVKIKGNRKNPYDEISNQLYSGECFWGSFSREFSLPSSVDTREMQASFRNGILFIKAPRIAPSGIRRIQINQ